MAMQTSLPELLDTLTQSLSAALEATPDASTTRIPKDGISLLDIKNDLLLSYLQNLVFLILLKLRRQRSESEQPESREPDDSVVKKLVELRVYIEKGVRPLEGRLKYQIDKVLRAADDSARNSASASRSKLAKLSHITPGVHNDKSEDSDSDSDSTDDDSEAGLTDGATSKPAQIDDLQYRPQPSSMVRPADASGGGDQSTTPSGREGLYRPPRITATAMPTTTTTHAQERSGGARKPNKSATLDEFITTELSSAPFAEPSIGSTIISGGRKSQSERERKDEAERREYEERNYVRLPKESKKERAKKNGGSSGGARRDAGYGGEEWRGLGEGLDRIDRLTKRKSGGGGGDGGRTMLERSRKRLLAATGDGQSRMNGGLAAATTEIGQGFQKRLKTMGGGRRDRGRR